MCVGELLVCIQNFMAFYTPCTSIFGAFVKFAKKRLSSSSCVTVRLSAWNNSAHTERISMEFDIWVFFFRISVQKTKVSLKSDKNNRYFTWRPIHIFITPRSIILRMRNFSENIVEKIKTHILCSITFFQKSCRLWDNVEKNIVERGKAQMTIWRMGTEIWISKAKNTHTQKM